MPPKSKKRVKRAIPNADSERETEPVTTTALDSRTHPNDLPINLERKGFLALPNELISQILSYFPEIKMEHILMNPTSVGSIKNAPNFFVRFEALRALSQLCRSSRQIFLPLLWERFQVCLTTNTGGQWYRNLGKAMQRRSKGMLKSQHLWPYVRVVTVSLTRFQTTTVLPPFVSMLRALPNVHTLEIPHAHSAMTTALKEAFEGSIFPSIQIVVMPTCAHEILRCCPSVREVTCNEGDGGRLVGALAQGGCKKLEILRGVAPGANLMKRFIKESPPLRCVGIDARSTDVEKLIQNYSSFPSLRVLEIDCGGGVKSVDHLVKIAQDTLRACMEYRPATSAKKSRKNAGDDVVQTTSELVDLYSDPRVVRVLHFPPRHSYYLEQLSSEFVPSRIDEFPV